jgi:hypothetical protein
MPPSWLSPTFLSEAHAWICAQLEALGTPVIGEIETMHQRSWSAVLIAPITGGRVYFKACAPHLSDEPALTDFLYRLWPDRITRLLAVNRQRRWLLLADEGVRMRELMTGPEELHRWETILPRFAEMQIELIPRADELLALGLVDHHVALLPGMFAGLLEDGAALGLGKEYGLSVEQHAALRAIQPRYAGLIARLTEFPIPNTLHHDDFHDGNVFYRDGRYTFSDWGDSCLTHPFFSMVINLRSNADRLGMPDEATDNPDRLPPELNRLRDAYLEPWTRFAPMSALREIFPSAWRAGMVNRALGWYNEISHMDAGLRPEYGYIIPAWLSEFLTAMG